MLRSIAFQLNGNKQDSVIKKKVKFGFGGKPVVSVPDRREIRKSFVESSDQNNIPVLRLFSLDI